MPYAYISAQSMFHDQYIIYLNLFIYSLDILLFMHTNLNTIFLYHHLSTITRYLLIY